MNQDSIPEDATKLCMEYTIYREVTLPDDINREDIARWWVHWGTLHIEMKDGTTLECEPDTDEGEAMESVNWKRGHRNLSWVDEDENEVSA